MEENGESWNRPTLFLRGSVLTLKIIFIEV